MCLLFGVALVNKIDKIIGLFCKRAIQKRLYFAKETYNLIDPANRSHPIAAYFFIISRLLEDLCVCGGGVAEHHVCEGERARERGGEREEDGTRAHVC